MAGFRANFDARRGFTLLEVMVALAILGLALSAILSAQAGLYDANVRARNLTLATSASRCKMTELEEKLITQGYPEIDQDDEGPCCDSESPPGMTCRWHIQRVLLPDPPSVDLEGGVSLEGGLPTGGSSGGLGGLGALAGLASGAGIGDGGISGVSDMLAGGLGAGGMSGSSGIAGMALSMVYPVLRPMLEASIRRVDVEVVWNEGPNERKVELVQFVTNPTKGLPPALPGADGGVGGVPGQPGTNSPTVDGGLH